MAFEMQRASGLGHRREPCASPCFIGSYWRKFQRNKKIRQEEKAREAIAKMWMQQQLLQELPQEHQQQV
jgi:hypothetical protein